MKYSIQSAKLDIISCLNSFCLASCVVPDNSKRQRCAWQAFGARKPTCSEYVKLESCVLTIYLGEETFDLQRLYNELITCRSSEIETMINYILVNNKYRSSVKDMNVIPGEDIVR